MDLIEQLSQGLADRVAAATAFTVGIHGAQRPRSGILYRPDVVVASEQVLADDAPLIVRRGPVTVPARLAGRDPGTNVAVLKLETPLDGALPVAATMSPRPGSLALVLGSDAEGGPTGRLAMVHAVGPAWHSMAGGRIDALIRLDTRLNADEGGPVLSLSGGLIGMSTSGPRRRTVVIPTATIDRVIGPLLAEGRIPRGWLGIGLQPVMIPDGFRQSTGHQNGLMVVSLVRGAPAETAGMLPGDIVLEIAGVAVGHPRALAAAMGPERIGQTVPVKLLRAGTLQTVSVTIAIRPAA
ncbi:MAG TPA: S1C family serine protease [Rhodopila sp.]|uniref:S1C family serine protease n=1 Tax=Rhodopila sp. TaxID=2480087 RepID=UPI002CE8D34E|nr:S1C family serine protease [Rhodopila sp.]HVY18407.1 S1C family serine protease [Rhodopila sp.]